MPDLNQVSDCCHLLLVGNVKLTGSALKWALNDALCKKKIKQVNELLFEFGFALLKTSFDKSWLDEFHTVEQSSDKGNTSLDLFCNEIDQERQRKYLLRSLGYWT